MLDRLHSRDPGWSTLRRALRAAVVVPVNFAIGAQLIGSAPVATFAAFGSFALLLFASFPGDRATRAGSYLVLVATGAVLITIGTLVATPDWLAVAAMAVVAFAVLFAGVVSSMLNAGTQAALLSFILAVMLPGSRSDLPARLGGWGLAALVSVPVAVLLWPPTSQDLLRSKAAALCRALAVMLQLEPPPPGGRDRLVVMREAARELRASFRTSAAQAAAIGAGARLGIRLVDELEWLATIVNNACADAPEGWSEPGKRLRTVAAQLLEQAADSLGNPGEQQHVRLEQGLAELARARRGVADEAVRRLRAGAGPVDAGVPVGEFDRPLYSAHELGYAVALCAGTVSAIGTANARSWWARLLGRRPGVDEIGAVAVAQRSASRHLDRHSVWLQNSIRGAVGLALAVLLSRAFEAQNAFWIGLGALSVLRTSATATGATIMRALAGTVLGFAIGGAAVALIGTDRAVLWTLLPLVILVSALAPAVIPFIAGQAAFTVCSRSSCSTSSRRPAGGSGCSGSRTSRSVACPASSRGCCCGRGAPGPRSAPRWPRRFAPRPPTLPRPSAA
ncbi:MAG: FUSC family protein [Jatrophihabitans sp.]